MDGEGTDKSEPVDESDGKFLEELIMSQVNKGSILAAAVARRSFVVRSMFSRRVFHADNDHHLERSELHAQRPGIRQ